MSVTIDADVLLYASDEGSDRHGSARDLVHRLAVGAGLVYLFRPVAMAYLPIATHAAIFERPLDPRVARANLEGLVGRAHIRCPGETPGFWRTYQTPSATMSSAETWSPTRISRRCGVSPGWAPSGLRT